MSSLRTHTRLHRRAALALAVALVCLACPAAHGQTLGGAVAGTAPADLATWPTKGRWPGAAPGTEVVVARGETCGPLHNIKGSPRQARPCAAESRVQLRVAAGGEVAMRRLPAGPARLAALPTALALQWRVCPFRPVAALELADSPWIRYEDPDIGPCYFWRPLDRERWSSIAARVREDRLVGIHPYLASVVRELAVRAAAQGSELRVIHAVSPMS